MTEAEFVDLVIERLKAKVGQRFPGGRGATRTTVAALVRELVADLKRDGIIDSMDATVRARVNKALGSLALAADVHIEEDDDGKPRH